MENLAGHIKNLENAEDISQETFLKELVKGMGLTTSSHDSEYISFDNNGEKTRLRFSDHSGNALSIIRKGKTADKGYSFVVKL